VFRGFSPRRGPPAAQSGDSDRAARVADVSPPLRDGLHVDWHCHSHWSDGQGTVAQLVDRAAAAGITLGIADHGLRDNRRLRTVGDIAAYLDDLAGHPVLRGLEISVGDVAYPAGILDELDFVVASLHVVHVPEGDVNATRYLNYRAGLYPAYRPALGRCDRLGYFDSWLRALETTLWRWPVTVLGHFCLLP
jgi:histidinol phosphatase-like PHP family hydrolase